PRFPAIYGPDKQALPNGSALFTGSTQLDGSVYMGDLQASGKISGPGKIIAAGSLTLSGDNDFTGGVALGTFTLGIASDTALGAGTLWIGREDNFISSGTLTAVD